MLASIPVSFKPPTITCFASSYDFLSFKSGGNFELFKSETKKPRLVTVRNFSKMKIIFISLGSRVPQNSWPSMNYSKWPPLANTNKVRGKGKCVISNFFYLFSSFQM